MVSAVVGAVEQEVWLVIDNMRVAKESRWAGHNLYRGSVEGREVVVTSTGIGKARTAAAVQHLIDRFPVGSVIFTGVAGAVNPELKAGDVVIGTRTVQHDYDVGGRGRPEEMKTVWFDAEPELVERAVEASRQVGLGDRTRVGTVLTGDQGIVDSSKRQWLHETFQGDCVEMEGAAVAVVCALNEVPFVIIRALTDLADESAREDFRRNMASASVDSARIALAMLGKTDGVELKKRDLSFRARRFLARRARAILGQRGPARELHGPEH